MRVVDLFKILKFYVVRTVISFHVFVRNLNLSRSACLSRMSCDVTALPPDNLSFFPSTPAITGISRCYSFLLLQHPSNHRYFSMLLTPSSLAP